MRSWWRIWLREESSRRSIWNDCSLLEGVSQAADIEIRRVLHRRDAYRLSECLSRRKHTLSVCTLLNWGAAVLRPYLDLGNYRVGFFWVDAQIFYGFGHYAGLDFAVLLELVERGQGDEAGVDFEEVAQRLAAFAAAEAVGA